MKIYGFTFIISDGVYDGRETFTKLFKSKEEMINAAYSDYIHTLNDLGIENLEDKNDVFDEKTFKSEIDDYGYVVAQYISSHCQWEVFMQEI